MRTWSYRVGNWPQLARISGFSCKNLASNLGISQRQLQRHFCDIYRLELRQWLNEVRLHDARHLLDGRNSVKEVAFVLGFKQHSHFTREFKKLFGITPEKFSKIHFIRNPQFETEHFRIQGVKRLI